MEQKCLNCKFVGDDVVGGYRALVCRRYAPRFPTEYNKGIFPVTYGDNWCGEWELDTENRYQKSEED